MFFHRKLTEFNHLWLIEIVALLVETAIDDVHELFHPRYSPACDLGPDHVAVQQDLERACGSQLSFDGVADEEQHETGVHLVFLGPLVVLWRGLAHHLKGVPAWYEQQYDSELEYCYQCGDVFVQCWRRVVSSFDFHFRITLLDNFSVFFESLLVASWVADKELYDRNAHVLLQTDRTVSSVGKRQQYGQYS